MLRLFQGPTCSASGISLDGNDEIWEWGGTTSFEAYVKHDSFNNFGHVFDFSNGESSDNVYLSNEGASSTISWRVRQGSANKWLITSNFDSSTWTHVVVTVSGNTMKVYKNGVLAGTQSAGHDPALSRPIRLVRRWLL